MTITASSVSAQALYQDFVWPVLWEVLQLSHTATVSPNVGEVAPLGQQPQKEHSTQVRSCRALQSAVTHALVQLLNGGATEQKITVSTLEGVSSQFLLHAHGAPPTKPVDCISKDQNGILGSVTSSLFTSATAGTAVEVERLYLLICTAIQLSAQTDMHLLSSDRVPAMVATGPAAGATTRATAPARLPLGADLASCAVVAGICGISRHLTGSTAEGTRTAAPAVSPLNADQHVQPLWFTFLFVYLQQLSAHTPKDTSAYARFFEACKNEYARRIATDPLSSNDEDGDDSNADNSGTSTNALGSQNIRVLCGQTDARANELAALRAWSQVSPDLLKDTIARTRFRRAALLFKSVVPHMVTQAPTLVFLLVDLFCEFSRSWEALMQSVPHGSFDETLAERLTQYSTRSIAHDDATGVVPSVSTSATSMGTQQRQQCQCLIEAYGGRLALLLGEGTPHAHLVATVVCAVLASLYILPYTRSTGVSATDVLGGRGGASPAQSPTAAKAGQATTTPAGSVAAASTAPTTTTTTTAVARGKRDENVAISEMENAYRLPRRATAAAVTSVATSNAEAPATSPSAGGADVTCATDEVCITEAEWRLRRYAPFGQVLAHVHILELQKVHLFSVAATQMRVGRTAAQQTEHVRLLSLTALYCGVAAWDLAVLLYHFAECPMNPFVSPDSSPAPALPSAALGRYTAAVRQYVEQTRAELIVNTDFVGAHAGGFNDGACGRYGGGGGGSSSSRPQSSSQHRQQGGGRSSIPSRGELRTPRFIEMVSPDPLLLSWRAHLAAAEMAIVPLPAVTGRVGSSSAQLPAPTSGAGGTTSAAGLATAATAITAGSPSALSAPPSLTNTPSSPDALLSPCCFIRDIIIAGQYNLAAAGIKYLSENPFSSEQSSAKGMSMNVLLPPRRAFPHYISVVYYVVVVLRRWIQRWDALQEQHHLSKSIDDLRREMVSVLRSLFPLLATVQSYLAHQTLLTRLATHLAWLCKATAADAYATSSGASTSTTTANTTVFALVEQLLIYVFMPCLRVLPPAPAVYDALDDIVEVFTHFSYPDPKTHTVIPYGDSPATPLHMMDWLTALLPSQSFVSMYCTKQKLQKLDDNTRKNNNSNAAQTSPAPVYPHDAFLRKEREALLSQSLKRLNAENIEEYRAALRPILYAEPLLVTHRLFVQAIGYNNSFLDVHTHLLHGLPRTILTLILQQGLVLMARYAAEEKVTDANGESRTSILATFLATLWRDNVNRVDGTFLVRRVELALRSNSRHEFLLGTELCKALLAVMAYCTLEHEEKFSTAQLQALAITPSTTSFFGRGAMTSFRARFWVDTGSALMLLSPTDVFVTARGALAEALQQPCVVPLAKEDDQSDEDDSNEEVNTTTTSTNPHAQNVETQLTLGQLLLVHLCRLQNLIYELQRDLDGGAELILLASAERFNMINDMLIMLETFCPAPNVKSVVERLCALIEQVALPQVARYVETQQLRKFAAISCTVSRSPSPLTEVDAVYRVAIPTSAGTSSVSQLLQYFTAAHFEYSPIPYDAARQEWHQCMQRAQRLLAMHRATPHSGPVAAVLPSSRDSARARRAGTIIAWLKSEQTRLEAEELAHRHLLQSSESARAALREAFVRDLVPTDPHDAVSIVAADDALIDFALSYLLPRALLNLREAATVAAFFTWLFQQAEVNEMTNEEDEQRQQQQMLLRRAVDLALTFVSAVFTYFVAYTDGECKRLGYVLQRLLEIPTLSSHQQLKQHVAMLSPELLIRLPLLFGTSKPSEVGSVTGEKKDSTMSCEGTKIGGATAAVPSMLSTGRRGKANDTSDQRQYRSISAALFSHFFLTSPATTAYTNEVSPATTNMDSGASTGPAPQLPERPSLLSLAIARGLVEAAPGSESKAATALTRAQAPQLACAPVANESSNDGSAASIKPAPSLTSPPLLRSTPAIPLQLEAFVCRALLQLLTHDGDVPTYAQRNQFLILEQLDKTTFPSTLCAVDMLIRAMEPHASKTKSYYALASAVLKSLRLNRRRRREAQYVIATLSRGEAAATNSYTLNGGSTDSPVTTSTGGAAAANLSVSLKEGAAACHAQWRLREHYMKQLLQTEVARLLSDQQVGRQNDDEDSENEDEEKQEQGEGNGEIKMDGEEDDAAGEDKDLQHSCKDEEGVGDVFSDGDEEEDEEGGDGEEGEEDEEEEGEEEEEVDDVEDSRSYSGTSDEGSDAEDDNQAVGGSRKRLRKE